MQSNQVKILIITYYWPPSSGSGVQRWMYFAKYLAKYNIIPVVLTVDPKRASYRKLDENFNDFVKDIEVHRTKTIEPLKLYSLLTTGNPKSGIPQGGVGKNNNGLFSRISRYIRGNVFIPDARIGWKKYAVKAAQKIISEQNIDAVITTGPPHSTHLIGRVLKRKYDIKWLADFRDPWTEIYYNKDLLQSEKSKEKDRKLELSVLKEANHILTIGPSMVDLLVSKIPNEKDKVSYILNGYDAAKMDSIVVEKNPEYMLISFVGLLTNAMPHETISSALHAFTKKHDTRKIKIRLAGDICDEFISNLRSFLQPEELEYLGYITHTEALRAMKSADILFTCLPEQDHSKIMISGKILEYIATGNAILCIGDPKSDAAKLLAQNRENAIFTKDNIANVEDYLSDKYKLWSEGKLMPNKIQGIEKMSRLNTTSQLAELIRKII